MKLSYILTVMNKLKDQFKKIADFPVTRPSSEHVFTNFAALQVGPGPLNPALQIPAQAPQMLQYK